MSGIDRLYDLITSAPGRAWSYWNDRVGPGAAARRQREYEARERQRKLDNLAGLSLAGAGVGGSTLATNQLLRSGIKRFSGTSADFVPELAENLDSYADSFKIPGSVVDKGYNYALTGNSASASKVFQGSNETAAHALDRLAGAASDKIDKLIVFLRKRGVPEERLKAIRRALPRKSLLAASHHENFAMSPLEAYMAMVHESSGPFPGNLKGWDFNLGMLTDEILDAHANYNNLAATGGRVFSSPSDYFVWKHGDKLKLGRSAKPTLREFMPSKAEMSKMGLGDRLAAFRRALSDYRASMGDWKVMSGMSEPLYKDLFEKTKGMSRDDILRSFGAGWVFGDPKEVASITAGDLFDKIYGKANSYRFNRDGTASLVRGGGYRRFDTLGRLMEHRTLLNDFIDPTVFTRFRYASKPYANWSKLLKTIRLTSSKGMRNAGIAGLALGGAGYAASKLMGRKEASYKGRNMVKKSDDNGRGPTWKDLLASTVGVGSLTGAGAYTSMYRPKDFNPFAGVSATVMGGIRPYDPVARDMIPKTISMAENALAAAKAGDVSKMQSVISMLEPVANGNGPEIQKDQAGRIVNYFKDVLAGGDANKPIEDLLPSRVLKAFRQDSFSSQTQSTMDELRRRGINIDRHLLADNGTYSKRFDIKPSDLRGSDIVVQVGSHPQEKVIAANRAAGRAKNYRVLSDFGPGNMNQPDQWVGYNWMKINDPTMYDRMIVPGGSYFDSTGAMKNVHGLKPNLNIDNIAVSPLFGSQPFSHDAGAALADPAARRAKAMFAFGGGSAGILGVHDPHIRNATGDAGKAIRDTKVIDELLDALKSRHGNNFDLDLYVGNALSAPPEQTSVDFVNLLRKIQETGDKSRRMREVYNVYKDLPSDLQDAIRLQASAPDSEKLYSMLAAERENMRRARVNGIDVFDWFDNAVHKTYRKVNKAIALEKVLESRGVKRDIARILSNGISEKDLRPSPYENVRVIGTVPQSTLAKAYGSSDYVVMLPGSTSGEYLSMPDNPMRARGRLITVVPEEFNGWTPSHFGTNAEYAKHVLPDTRVVKLNSKTRAQDFIDAIAGKRIDGRKILNTSSSWDDVVRVMKNDVRLARLGRLGKLGLIAAPGVAAAGYGVHRLFGKGGGKSEKASRRSDSRSGRRNGGSSNASIGDIMGRINLPDWAGPAAAGAAGTLGAIGLANYLRRKFRDSDEDRGYRIAR